MSGLEYCLFGFSLAMDAFAVSIGKGMCIPTHMHGKRVTLSFLFGFFQFLMPVIGYFVGIQFASIIQNYDHWIIFLLLGYLGISMIREGSEEEDTSCPAKITIGTMMLLAVATSLDALAVGITFAFLSVKIWTASSIIGIITFGLSLVGVYLGRALGNMTGRYASYFGGIVLIGIGVKILLEHLGYL